MPDNASPVSTATPTLFRSSWSERIRRADELLALKNSASEVLGLYRHLLTLQKRIAEEIQLPAIAGPGLAGSIAQVDVDRALRWFPELLAMLEKRAPTALAREAQRLRDSGIEQQRIAIADFLRSNDEDESPDLYLVRMLLQPFSEAAAMRAAAPADYFGSRCPLCGRQAQCAALRPEGDGGKRYLCCSSCLTQWQFRRILCPVCGESDATKLPRYSPEEPAAVRVEACDTCKSYLKSFDLTLNGWIVPEVDEVATVALDIWAAENGYRKIERNVMGF